MSRSVQPPTVSAWMARPLVTLLPFFMTGLALGPDLARCEARLWPAAILSTALLTLLSTAGRRLALIPTGLTLILLGAALSTSAHTLPSDPGHVAHLIDRPLVFGGVVRQTPRTNQDRTRLLVEVEEYQEPGGPGRPAAGLVLLTTRGLVPPLIPGNLVRFPAILRTLTGFGNPGSFDYRRHLIGQGIWASAFLKDGRLLIPVHDPTRFPTLRSTLLDQPRQKATIFLESVVGEPALGLMKALLLGDQDLVESDVQESFRILGLSHILSISGFHIGLVAALAFGLFRSLLLLWPGLALRVNVNRLAGLTSLIPVLMYASLAGDQPPVIRATLMVVVFLVTCLVGRFHDSLSALAAAAWIILVVEPGVIFAPSFQLSFAAAGAMIFLAPRFPGSPFSLDRNPEKPRPRGVKAWLWGLTITSIAATAGTTPIVLYHFHRLSLLSLPANLIFDPVIGLAIIPAGLVALSLIPIWPALAAAILTIIERVWWIILPALQAAAAWPGIDPLLPRPDWFHTLAFYGLVATLAMVRPWARAAGVSMALLGLVALTWILPRLDQTERPSIEATFLDVGQGAAAFLSLPDGTRIMIDGGGFPGSKFDTGEEIVAPFLLSRGITRLDILALSHPQTDHVGGLAFLAREFAPREIWTNRAVSTNRAYRALLTWADRRKAAQPDLAELHRWRSFGPARIRALAPSANDGVGPANRDEDEDRGDSPNNSCLVLTVQMGKRALLFPGDLESAGEENLIRRAGSELRADVLLAPHHGSATSMTPPFLAQVRPEIVVFSVGAGNRYGFPAHLSEARALRAGARAFRTDRDGAITVTTDGESLEVRTFRGN